MQPFSRATTSASGSGTLLVFTPSPTHAKLERTWGRAASSTPVLNLVPGSPTEIRRAEVSGGTKLVAVFADGQIFHGDVGVFEMPVDRIRWDTLTASPDGKGLAVTDTAGQLVELDAETVRFYLDPGYAAEVKARLARQRLSRADLAQLAAEPDPRPAPQPEGDFTRAAWR